LNSTSTSNGAPEATFVILDEFGLNETILPADTYNYTIEETIGN